MLALTPQNVQKVATDLETRLLVRRSTKAWARHVYPENEIALHHELICTYLDKASRREIRKLAIVCPPGAAKSTYSSRLFPSRFLAQDATQRILLCCCTKDLADDFGRTSRNLIDDNPKELGYALAKDSQAVDKWSTDRGGGFIGAGVGGRISGRRADLGLIDDPVGSMEEADSQDFRDKQWRWYLGDFKPRLKPNAVQIVIQTRFHEDDLLGRILTREQGWTVIHLPMLIEDESQLPDPLGRTIGQWLWPEWYTEEMVRDAQADARVWNCLYQGNPIPESGNYFNMDCLREYYTASEIPKNLKPYCASDHALGKKEENDSTWLGDFGLDTEGNIWILPSTEYGKFDTLTAVNKMMSHAQAHEPCKWFCEAAHIEKAIGPFLFKEMQEQECFFSVEQLSAQADKQAKARPMQGRIAQRKIFVPTFTSWWKVARQQLVAFPLGTHDDFIDMVANLCRGLQSLVKAKTPSAKANTPPPIFTMKWLKEEQAFQTMQEKALTYGR